MHARVIAPSARSPRPTFVASRGGCDDLNIREWCWMSCARSGLLQPLAGNDLPVFSAAEIDRARRGGLYRETKTPRMLRSRTQLTPHFAIRVLFTVHVDVELVVVIREKVRVVDERAVRHREGIRAGLGQ